MTEIDTGLTEEDLRDALFSAVDEMLSSVQPKQSGEFTLREYAKHAGITYDAAAKLIAGLVDAGKLTKRRTCVDGKSANVYGVQKTPPG
jgi:hypothetical protein